MNKQSIGGREKKKEDWMNSKWRPLMGYMYMGICTFDFILAPVLWTMVQALFHGGITSQWQPLTLQGAGLFHLAMGAVLGIAAHGRTQEKLNGAETGGVGSFGQGAGTTYVPPGQGSVTVSNQPNAGGFGGGGFSPQPSQGGFGGGGGFSPQPSQGGFGGGGGFSGGFNAPVTGQVAAGFGGKMGPVPGQDPIL